MRMLSALAAEARKAMTLPATFAGLAVTLFGSSALTLLNAVSVRGALDAGQPQRVASTAPFDTVLAAAPLGTVGAVVLGVVMISSEYTANRSDAGSGRQITATLAAIPRRLTLLAAKVVTVVVLVAVTAAATIPACLSIARAIIGTAEETISVDDVVARSLGVALYWTLTALMAFAVTVLTRSGIIPLTVLIVNSSLVPFSLLLSNLTPLAHYLPDLAGRHLLEGGQFTIDGGLDPVTGTFVMGAWTLALLAIAGAVFARRNA